MNKKEYEVFEYMAQSRNNDYTFEIGYVVNESNGNEINIGKKLESDGYVKYSFCGVNKILGTDIDNVSFKGKFTEKGIEEINKNNIKIEDIKRI